MVCWRGCLHACSAFQPLQECDHFCSACSPVTHRRAAPCEGELQACNMHLSARNVTRQPISSTTLTFLQYTSYDAALEGCWQHALTGRESCMQQVVLTLTALAHAHPLAIFVATLLPPVWTGWSTEWRNPLVQEKQQLWPWQPPAVSVHPRNWGRQAARRVWYQGAPTTSLPATATAGAAAAAAAPVIFGGSCRAHDC
jgi:hypothetical protein